MFIPGREGRALTKYLAFGALTLAALAWSAPSKALPTVVDQLQNVHQQRQDVRYVFGGCDDTRMDCSCFVQTAFKDAFGRKLPRTTLSQTRFFESELLPRLKDIRRLMPETLCPGDLIYTFRGDRWETASRHVAIYYQDGQILHSARGLGVGIQPLDVISHHRLRGVVRLFECRGQSGSSGERPPPSSSRARKPPRTPTDDSAEARNTRAVRRLVNDLFTAWYKRDRKTFASLWGDGALQWRKSRSGDESSVLSDWRQSFEELGGKRWRYGIRELQTRGSTAFVEVDTEHPCTSPARRGCDKTVQTFVWRLGLDGRWRIVQHEIGSAQ